MIAEGMALVVFHHANGRSRGVLSPLRGPLVKFGISFARGPEPMKLWHRALWAAVLVAACGCLEGTQRERVETSFQDYAVFRVDLRNSEDFVDLNHRARSSSIDHAATDDRAGVAAVRQR